jgi:hypothetical protein
MSRKSLWIAALLLAALGLPAAQADKAAGRARVKDFAFEFQPSPVGDLKIPAMKVSVLPMINENDVSRHTRNLEKAFRNMRPEEYPQVLGFRFNANGKPLNRFMTGETFEVILKAALEQELEALGLELVPAPIAEPPADFRRKTLQQLAESYPEAKPDVLIGCKIEDFFFSTRPGPFKLKMETFFILDVVAYSLAEDDFVWEGTVEAGELEKKAMIMGREAVDNRLDASFKELIEGVVRNNSELLVELTKL